MSKFEKLIKDRVVAMQELVNLTDLDEFKKKQIKVNWLDFIILLETLVKRHYLRYNVFNLIVLIGGVLIPVLLNVIPNKETAGIIVTMVSVLVAVCSGILQSYKINDRWRHFRLISEQLKIEGEKFFALTGEYNDYSTHAGCFKLFINNVENIKSSQIEFYIKSISKGDSKESGKEENMNT